MPSGAWSRGYTYSSSDPNVLEVLDETTGKVKAVGKGYAVLSVCTFNNKWASVGITVMNAPESIALNLPEDDEVGVGQPLSVTATLPEGTAGSYTFSVDPQYKDTLEVNETTGALTAKVEGTAKITVTAYSGASDEKTITVVPAPDTITLSETYIEMGTGEWSAFPQITIDEGTKASYYFGSSKPKVVTVYADGTLWARKAGTAVITVATHNQKYAWLTVRVRKAPKKVYIGVPYVQMGLDQEMTAWASVPSGAWSRGYTYSSSDPNVLEVLDETTGKVKAVGKGYAVLSVCTFNNKWASVGITVLDKPMSIALNLPEDDEVAVGQPLSVTATLPEGTAGSYTFSVDPQYKDTLEVNETTGALTAKVEGTAKITVTAYSGASDEKTITVVPAPDTITLSETYIEMGAGEWAAFPTITPDKGKASYYFSSSKPKVVTVYGDGTLWARKAGTAVITVATHNQKYAWLTVKVYKAPKKAYISAPYPQMGVDQEMTAWAWPNSGTVSRGYTYSSSDPNVLEVLDAAKGTVKAVSKGYAVLSVCTFNNKWASMGITVLDKPTSITLNLPEDDAVAVGQPLSVTATLPEGTAGSYTFKSDNPDIVDVDENSGALDAKVEGDAEITVTTYNNVSATKTIHVVPAPESISLSEEYIEMGAGEWSAFPTITPDNGKASYYFGSSKPKVVTVYADGTLWARKAGTAVITVMTHNQKYAWLTVRVYNAPKKAYISAHHTSLGVGEKLKVDAWVTSGTVSRALTFTSNNEDILKVTNAATGEIEAVSPGVAAITVATFNGKYASLWFTVLEAPTSVTLTPQPLTLGAGEWYTISSTTQPENSGGGRTYSIVAGEDIATIDPTTGLLHALTVGEATVRVTMYNDLCYDEFTLTVKPAPTGIQLNNVGYIELGVGDSFQIPRPTPLGEDVHSETFTYASSKTKYVTVSATGWVYAKKEGSAVITVRTYNGCPAAFTVKVKAAPKSIAFTEVEHRLFMDREYTPTVWFANGVPGNYTLTSSDDTIVKVCEDGKTVKAIHSGTVTLTAVSYNGKYAWMQIWVPELPDQIWLTPESLVLGEGDSATMTVGWPEGAGAEMTYESEDSGTADVGVVDNETITVSAMRMGATRIHAHSQNDKDAYASITVKKAPTALFLSPRQAVRSIEEEPLQLGWGFGGDEEGGRVTFSSSDASIATVSETGLVKFLRIGTVRITARTYNGHEAYCDLCIGERPGEMFFDQEVYQVALDDSITIPASFDKGCVSYTLQAENSDFVEIKGDVVHALQKGTVKLTATSNMYGLTAECTVEVVDAPNGIRADIEDVIELVVGINSTQQLHAIPLLDGEPSVGSVHYTSSDPAVAVVDYNTGLVIPKGKGANGTGECEITATTYNGYSTTYSVKVTYLLEGVKIGIDPGHQGKANSGKESSSPRGGSSKAKVSSGTRGCVTRIAEHQTVLTIGLQLRDALVKLGAEVVMTRESANVDISNKQRAILMNNNNVDLALRLHCDSADTSSAKGLGIFVRGSCAWNNDELVAPYDTKTALMNNESRAAKALFNSIIEATRCSKRKITYNNDYTMNNWCKMPCLLVEMGFMSNPTDDRNLNNPDYQVKLVRGMVNGICDYVYRQRPTEW